MQPGPLMAIASVALLVAAAWCGVATFKPRRQPGPGRPGCSFALLTIAGVFLLPNVFLLPQAFGERWFEGHAHVGMTRPELDDLTKATHGLQLSGERGSELACDG